MTSKVELDFPSTENIKLPEQERIYLDALLSAAILAGQVIIQNENQNAVSQKPDEYMGHHAIVTSADLASQEIIINHLQHYLNEPYFITEEKSDNNAISSRALGGDNFHDHLNQLIAIIDPLDGTSQNAKGLPEWSISIGLIQHGVPLAAVIYGPDVRGGFVLVGINGHGVYLSERGKFFQPLESDSSISTDNATFNYGVDIPLDQGFNNLINNAARRHRSNKSIGSCALGLAFVATGKIDVLIQPPQRIWDMAAGWMLVKESGRAIAFYRIDRDNKRIIFLEDDDQSILNPAKKDVGFIAGQRLLVQDLSAELRRQYLFEESTKS